MSAAATADTASASARGDAATASSTTSSSSSILIPSLPNDIAVNILARIPRRHHPTLATVSKPFRRLLSSPIFFTTRSLLRSTEPLLYLSLRSHHCNTLLCFTLHHNRLVPIPPIPISSIGSTCAVVGSDIYVIGGSVHDVPTHRVWILDCRFNKWAAGPAMRVGREFSAAGVVNGKIYVIGGCVVDTWARATNWAQVFDPATGKWAAVASPAEMIREKWMHASAVLENRIYAMADRGGVVYEPQTGRWESVGTELDMGWRGRACVVDEILYCYDYLGKIRGFDVKDGVWKELKVAEKGLPKFLCGATMANLGGKLAVVWECKGNGNGKEMEIWCAAIEVEKGEDGGLLGRICWSAAVLKVPNGSSIVHCLAVEV